MIVVKVETEFTGNTVAVRDKFVDAAVKHGLPITIKHKGNSMTIKHDDIKDSITGKSKKPVADYYGDRKNYLYYFRWKPNQVAHQRTLKGF